MISGNINGIKKGLLNELNEICCEDYATSDFVNYDMINRVCKVSIAIGREIALKIARNGELLELIIGDYSSVKFSAAKSENKFNGIRFVHTHINGDYRLSSLDISALINNNLDCVCAVGIDNSGYMLGFSVAVIGEQGCDTYTYKNCQELNNSDILDKILLAEEGFKDKNETFTVVELKEMRAISVLVCLNSTQDVKADLVELKELAQTDNIEVVGEIIQLRKKPNAAYLIGTGKLDEIRSLIQLNNANMVIFDNELEGSKLNNLELALGVKVIDRNMMILDIFAGRAKSNEGKLQVELAQLKFSLPRLSSLSGTNGRFGGGVGMRGPGETKIELERRVIDKKIGKLELRIKKLSKQRILRRERRETNRQKTVSLVGYTNSGKSTLLNTITKSSVYVMDQLFATLDTTTRNVWVAEDRKFLLTDTVGFISKLPHEFIDAFSSTLEETIYADLLLHIVDVSNPQYKTQMKVVDEVLKSIDADNVAQLIVFNKIDKVKDFVVPKGIKNYVCISAKDNTNIDVLKDLIIENLYE